MSKRYFSYIKELARSEGCENLKIKVPWRSRLASYLEREGWKLKGIYKNKIEVAVYQFSLEKDEVGHELQNLFSPFIK